MWHHIRTAVTLFLFMSLLTEFIYPLVVTGVAQALLSRQANGSLMEHNGQKIASELIGQSFTEPRYFWGRPSATAPVPYNGISSGGSNFGPSHPDLKTAVQKRIAVLRAADPGNLLPIPVDLVTSSGSGLDPHITPAAALYQVSRVAKARGIGEKEVAALVRAHIDDRQLGILGESTVHALRLNMALDALR